MAKKYESDIIIIGGGVGGLICGAILAKKGYSITLCDANAQLGGSLQVFSREKTVFDSGVHYLGGLSEGENLYQVFKYLDVLKSLDIDQMNTSGFEEYHFGATKQTYKIPQGWQNFEQQLISYFPDETDSIQRYVKDVQHCCQQFKLYNLEYEANEQPKLGLQSLSLDQYLQQLTPNKTLQKVLSGNALLYASGKSSTPFHLHALTINSYITGAYKLVNSGAQLTKALRKVIRTNGGQIVLRSKITTATLQDQEIVAIEDKEGNTFQGQKFIAGIHPKQIFSIFGKEHFKKSFYNRVRQLPNSTSAFSLFLNLKEGIFPYMDYNYFHADGHPLEIHDQRDNFTSYYMLSTPIFSNQGQYAKAANIMTYMNASVFEQFNEAHNTIADPGKRSSSYYDFKKTLEQELLDKVSEQFPLLKKATLRMESSTPLTFNDYLHSPKGSIYGIIKDAQKPLHSIIAPSTHIKNLYLAGQNLKLHGVVGVTMSSLLTLSELVDGQTLIHEIKNA